MYIHREWLYEYTKQKLVNKCTERMVVWVYIQKLVNKCTERMVVWVYIQKLVNKCT